MKKHVEILAPAGSYESLEAAIKAGADAVYIGGSSFGARAFAHNLDEEQLLLAIDYVHLHGRKIYLTINTLLKEREIEKKLYDYLLPYYCGGIDAVIVQDLGVFTFVKEHFPGLPIHASTQMTITNVSGARFMEEQGIERVVPARELNIAEIREIAEATGLDVECFVHGALCYGYSGQCLYSSILGGRSGNRGQCAQPCRLPYGVDGAGKPSYLLSLKDICTLDMIPEMVEAGITSFKIEGRMKKPEYVALVTSMYRKYLDLYIDEKDAFQVDQRDKEMLLDLYNRGGSCDGYYHAWNGQDMVSRQRPNHAGVPAVYVEQTDSRSVNGKALTAIHAGDIIELPDGQEKYTFGRNIGKGEKIEFITHHTQKLVKGQTLNRTRNENLLKEVQNQIIERKIQEKINGKLTLSKNESATLELSFQNIAITVQGEQAQQAQNQPISRERVEKQIRKTGNTEFTFDKLELEMEEDLFLSMQGLNDLRRQGIEALSASILAAFQREKAGEFVPVKQCSIQKEVKEIGKNHTLFVSVEQPEQFDAVVECDEISRIYIDCNIMPQAWKNSQFIEMANRGKASGKEIYFAMPYIFRKETKELYLTHIHKFLKADYDGMLIRNLESYAFLLENGYDKPMVLDSNMYRFNNYSRIFWERQKGIQSYTAPLELNERELKELGMFDSELIIYGHIPMMISAQCIQNTTKGCTHKTGFLNITDRYHKEFTVKNCCDYCYNVIYNTSPTMLADKGAELSELEPFGMRLAFTVENGKMARRIVKLYSDTILHGKTWDSQGEDFTRGHFNRGIK